MARLISTTVRLTEEDVRALKRARAAGHSASELVRKGLRVVASRYYSGRRPPSTRLFESTDIKLGDESDLFRGLEDSVFHWLPLQAVSSALSRVLPIRILAFLNSRRRLHPRASL